MHRVMLRLVTCTFT